MKLSDYDDAKFAESRDSVAKGGSPLRRTTLPGTIKPLGESLVLTPDSNFATITLTQPQIILLDDETLHKLQRSMEASLGHALKIAARNPFITCVAVVTDALARSYWSPDVEQSGNAAMWARAFKLDPKDVNTPKRLFRLAAEPTQGMMTGGATALKDDGVMDLLLDEETSYATSYKALSLMDKLEEISEVGSSLLRSDPLLRERYVCNGEVSTFTNASLTGGGEIKGILSSPSKLRVAKPLLVMIGREAFNTEILRMSYKKNEGGLIATIKATGKGVSISKFMARETPYLTNKPYTGSGFTPKMALRERLTTREVPLDVTLAAFGEQEEEAS